MQTFKLRAECEHDITTLRAVLNAAEVKIAEWTIIPDAEQHPDRELVFSCDAALKTVRHAIAIVTDGHVMYETVSVLGEYTGERTYSEY